MWYVMDALIKPTIVGFNKDVTKEEYAKMIRY
jgi:hypothetical protein